MRNIKRTGKNGKIIDKDVKTDSGGKAKLKVDEHGEYTLSAAFKGKGFLAVSSLSDTIKVEKPSTELVSEGKAVLMAACIMNAPLK